MTSTFVGLSLLAFFTFLIYRLRLFSGSGNPGRYPFLIGSILVLMSLAWQVVITFNPYHAWFIQAAYFWIDFGQLAVFLGGLLLLLVGLALYADSWQIQQEHLDSRHQKLSILTNVQQNARQPYNLMELLDMTIREIVVALPETAGALLLVNRSRRQFVLASSAGLTQQERSLLEYYPFERNIVSQAIELKESFLTRDFTFVGQEHKEVKSRFKSILILPLVSADESSGAIILFAEKEDWFGRNEISFLSPVADWLAEKMKSTRLSRELNQVSAKLQQQQRMQADLATCLRAVADKTGSGDHADAYCREIVGFAGSQTVHLFGLEQGSLHIHAGSAPLSGLSESYRAALIEALDRNKPLIVNQESTDEAGRNFVSVSSLVLPLEGAGRDAMLLRKENGAFNVSDSDLKGLTLLVQLAALVLQLDDAARTDLARRRGFDQILRLLDLQRYQTGRPAPVELTDCLATLLPPTAKLITLERREDGSLQAVGGRNVPPQVLSDIAVIAEKGRVAEMASGSRPAYMYGLKEIRSSFQTDDADSKVLIQKLLDDTGQPVLMAVCPVSTYSSPAGAVLLFIQNMDDNQRQEWERMITLATGLFTLGLSVARISSDEREMSPTNYRSYELGSVANRLNNHFSAIIGNAELIKAETGLHGGSAQSIKNIIAEVEMAAQYVRQSLNEGDSGDRTTELESGVNVSRQVEQALKGSHISENLFMLAGRPREVDANFENSTSLISTSSDISQLFKEALNHFASLTDEDDIISVSTYVRDKYLYLDISRHRRSLPSVQQVAGFGRFENSREVLRERPNDHFLGLIDSKSAYSFDRFNPRPSYLSFRFALSGKVSDQSDSGRKINVLAIDDQAVILDLLKAMCLSSGYEIKTASSGGEGVELATRHEFDIVLTDLAMPGMSGLEAARAIRRLHPKVPIILITGWGVDIDQAQLEASGITEVLYKPFRLEQLTELISSSVFSGTPS